jgi:hypothetical protein
MSHLSTKCDCGRTIHFPKDSPIGTDWKCKDCGKIWTLSDHGKPAYDTRSKRPPKSRLEYQNPSSRSSNSASSGGCIVVGILLFSGITGSAIKLIEYLFS